MDKKAIEQSLHKMFVQETLEALPLDEEQQQWKVRFQYIQMQPYCWNCKKWNDDASYDYCGQCGCDYYSHMDLKNGQIAPIRRGRCQSCPFNSYVQGSLNGKLQCQICFYKSIGKAQKAAQVESKLIKIIEQLKKSPQAINIAELKKKRASIFSIRMALMAGQKKIGQKDVKDYIEPWMIEWSNNPQIPIKIKNQLQAKLVQKQKEMYAKQGITY